MNIIVVFEDEPSLIQRHGGPQYQRNTDIYVNGELFESFEEDSAPNYNSGKYYDAEIEECAQKIVKFFGGTIIRVKKKFKKIGGL